MLLYHLTTPPEWERALSKGTYRPSNFKTEGFIHCSTHEQLAGVAERYFQEHDLLVVLVASERKLKPHLKWEPSTNEELFPHYYKGLELSLIETTHMLSRNRAGEWEWDFL